MRFLFAIMVATLAGYASAAPIPFPIFLKAGFSTILDFDDTPTRVVLGDPASFQIEKLDRSIVIKTLAPYATTNMFVYFRAKETRLFVITASEDAEPTYYRKFEDVVLPKSPSSAVKSISNQKRLSRVTRTQFDKQKDYLTVDVLLAADSKELIKPSWNLVRLLHSGKTIVPYKLWSERKDVQKDSSVKARFIFVKPNVPRTLKDVSLVIPLQGNPSPVRLTFVERPR